MHQRSAPHPLTAWGGGRRILVALAVSAALITGGLAVGDPADAKATAAWVRSGTELITRPTASPTKGDGESLETNPTLKRRAAQLTSSFENSTVELQYGYAENIDDGNGITAGRAGFTSGTNDLLQVVRQYTALKPGNRLAKYLGTLEKVDGTDNTKGLDGFPDDWERAIEDPLLTTVQDDMVDKLYFYPAMRQADAAGLKTALGQAIMWDTYIQHGEGSDIGTAQIVEETNDAMGGNADGNESEWLNKFLDIRFEKMRQMYNDSEDDSSRSRISALRSLVEDEKFTLDAPLRWEAYGDEFSITQ